MNKEVLNASLDGIVVLLQIILVCKTIMQRPKRDLVNYFIVLFIC